jgi:hypothetical protein
MRRSLFFLVLIGLLSSSMFLNAKEYKFLKAKNGMSLYERWISGSKENVRELKAEFVVKSTIKKVLGIIQSQSKGKQWQTKASEYKIIKSQSTNEWLTYIKYDMPMFMDDQECLLLYTIDDVDPNSKLCSLSFSSTEDIAFPITKSVKRISGVVGKWVLKQVNENEVQVSYLIASDRDKSIPRFVSDPIIQDNLFTSMGHFKNLVEA